MVFCREDIDSTGPCLPFMPSAWSPTAADLDNICFTVMTSFPLQSCGLALTSIPQPASLVRSSPPLEKAIAPPLQPRTDQPRRRRSNSSATNAGDHLSPETRPCPRPSSDDRRPVRILAGTTDGRDGLLGNVDSQRRDAAHLNAQAGSEKKFTRTNMTT